MLLFLDDSQYIDTKKGMDISLPLSNNEKNLSAWYVNPPIFESVKNNNFIGSVAEGGSVNFRNISFNPHGHGTHTECLGHITEKIHSINQCLKTHFFSAKLISISPEKQGNDFILTKDQFEKKLTDLNCEALIIRTLPNKESKKHQNYSATNPPYIAVEAIEILNQIGVKHLLVDLPSVDQEDDGGILAFHHAFWEVPQNPQFDKTITELIFVPDTIKDGDYILNLQTAPFENDATPSRPVLFEILSKN